MCQNSVENKSNVFIVKSSDINLHEESKPGKISRGIVVGTELEIPGIKQKFADDL